MEKIKILLSGLGGVKTVAKIPKEARREIIDMEKGYERSGVVGLKNIGIKMVMQCDSVFAILKDAGFRSPPDPTVIMVEDHKDTDKRRDHLLKIDNKDYRIIGEEVIDKNLPDEEEYIFISDDFILYPDRRKGETRKPAYFLVPPIKFKELEEEKEKYKIDNIISISPSTLADDYIRKICDFSLSNKLATILVGYDMENHS